MLSFLSALSGRVAQGAHGRQRSGAECGELFGVWQGLLKSEQMTSERGERRNVRKSNWHRHSPLPSTWLALMTTLIQQTMPRRKGWWGRGEEWRVAVSMGIDHQKAGWVKGACVCGDVDVSVAPTSARDDELFIWSPDWRAASSCCLFIRLLPLRVNSL